MKIPEKVKIGAKIYTVTKTEHLYMGAQHYGGEIIYTDLKINIRSNLPHSLQEHYFLHELIHGIGDHLGYTEQDEKFVDSVASALHMVITDNPEIFAKEETKDV